MISSIQENINLQDKKVVLITGAARRIGRQIAEKFHANNYRVIVHYHQSEADAHALINQLNTIRANSAHCIQADLNDHQQLAYLTTEAIKKWQRIDVLINNASLFFPTPLQEANQESWDALINSNLKAPYFLCQHLAEELQNQKGAIINIADIFADKPKPEHSIYCIAKAGNVMLTKSMAIELAPNVRVNGISPGAILWPEDKHGNEIINKEVLTRIPLNTLGGAAAIADCAYHLATQATYTSGQIIAIDGGKSISV